MSKYKEAIDSFIHNKRGDMLSDAYRNDISTLHELIDLFEIITYDRYGIVDYIFCKLNDGVGINERHERILKRIFPNKFDEEGD